MSRHLLPGKKPPAKRNECSSMMEVALFWIRQRISVAVQGQSHPPRRNWLTQAGLQTATISSIWPSFLEPVLYHYSTKSIIETYAILLSFFPFPNHHPKICFQQGGVCVLVPSMPTPGCRFMGALIAFTTIIKRVTIRIRQWSTDDFGKYNLWFALELAQESPKHLDSEHQ